MTRGNQPAGTSKFSSVLHPSSSHETSAFRSSSAAFPLPFPSGHCAYVVEKTVTFTVQDGAAPYVKAEYNKCSWGQKCPTLL